MVKKNKYLSEIGHLNDEYVSLYIDAHLLNKVKELPYEILKHVEDCNICKQNIIDGYDILKTIKEINVDEHLYFKDKEMKSSESKKRNFAVLYRIAASIVFIISIGIIGFNILNRLETSDKISKNLERKFTERDSVDENIIISKLQEDAIMETGKIKDENQLEKEKPTKKIELNNLIAENKLEGDEFQVSPIMISMLGANTRADFFELKYPKDSIIFENQQQINFAWDSDISEEIKIKIFNYKDDLVFESKILESNELNLIKTLLPGAYIWKIEGNDAIYHLGLFFVKRNDRTPNN